MTPDAPACTVRQLAERWQVSERHVYDLIAQGKVGHIRIGTLIRVRREDIAAYEAKAWHAPEPSNHNTGSLSAAVVSMSAGGAMARGSAFQRGRKIGAKLNAS